MRSYLLKAFLIIASVLAGLPISTPSFAQTPYNIKVAATSAAAVFWPTFVATDRGFFAENGIKDEIIYTGAGTQAAMQLIAGAFEFAFVDVATALRAAATGADIAIVAVPVIKFPFNIMVAKDIHSIKDLVGKKVMLGYKNDLTTVFWNRVVIKNGLKVSDIDQVFDSASPTRYAALSSGAAQAASLSAPFDFRAIAEGFHYLPEFVGASEGYAFLALIARRSWLKDNAKAASGYLRAQLKAMEWLHDPSNKAKAIEIIARDTKQDQAIATQTYDYMIADKKMFNRDLRLAESYVKAESATLVELGEIKQISDVPGTVLDMSFLPN